MPTNTNEIVNETETPVTTPLLAVKAPKVKEQLPEQYRGLPSKSAIIKAMNKDGWTTARIFKILNDEGLVNHYQHVRNVLVSSGLKTIRKG